MSMSQRKNKDVKPQAPNEVLKAIIKTVERLCGLYRSETEALVKADTKVFLSLQNDKVRMTELYKDQVREISSRKGEFDSADNALKQKLKVLREEFSALIPANMKALERMKKTSERLADTIRNAAKEAARKQGGFAYAENGAMRSTVDKQAISAGYSENA